MVSVLCTLLQNFVLLLRMITKGIGFILLATLSFAMMNLVAKDLSSFHAMQIVIFRAFGTFVFLFPIMLYKRISIIGNNPKLLSLRASAGLISLATFFMAIQRIPLGSAISLRYLGPIFGALLAFFFLKEKVNAKQWFSFAIAFSGVLVMKGFDVRIDNFSLFLVLNSALFVGIVFVLLRYLGDKEHYMTIINYFMVFCIVASLFFIPYWRMPVKSEMFSVISIGIFGLIGQLFMTKALQLEETSVLAPFKYMELVYALIFTNILFGETQPLMAFVGMGLIIGGMLLNIYFKKRKPILADN